MEIICPKCHTHIDLENTAEYKAEIENAVSEMYKKNKDALSAELHHKYQQKERETRHEIEKATKAAYAELYDKQANQAQLLVAERDLLISQMGKQIEILRRKSAQGSVQLQGEAQELIIEEWLARQFPHDDIDEIKKGAKGGDCIQIVNTRTRLKVGVIYYESKRTKTFQMPWLKKFKQDISDKNANAGILITETMPKGYEDEKLVRLEGVWVCGFDHYKSVVTVLRESLINVSEAFRVQHDVGNKAEMMYQYLSSDAFGGLVRTVFDEYKTMNEALIKERKFIMKAWEQREASIVRMSASTAEMTASIKSITGGDIKTIEHDPSNNE